MKKIKIIAGDIMLGRPLPWSIYDDQERMLLDRGQVITGDARLETLIARGIYRIDSVKKKINLEKFQITRASNPFDVLDEFSLKLKQVFDGLRECRDSAYNTLTALADGIQQLCDRYPDATLGAVQLRHSQEYCVYHSIYIAVLCEMIAKRMRIPIEERSSILCAALVCNIGMLELQQALCEQEDPPSDEQRKAILNHSGKGVLILEQAEIDDEMMVTIVHQHHEKTDGTGYPKGLYGDDILLGSRILALSDRYSAMISPRKTRKGMHAQKALRELFSNLDKGYDKDLSLLFIKELGIYPPGSFVRLVNGETAIVLRRENEANGTGTLVQSFADIDGNDYLSLAKRDCSFAEYAIKEAYVPNETPTYNLSMLWART